MIGRLWQKIIREGNPRERGVVLLTTMLVMTIMATLAIAMLDDLRFGLQRTINIQSQAQLRWYLRAAEDFSQIYLEENLSDLDSAEMNRMLLNPAPIVLPIEGGSMILKVMDGSQCLSLGRVAEPVGRPQFRSMLEHLGLEANMAANLISAIADWQDEDSQVLSGGAEDYTYLGRSPDYRAANTQFHSIMELRAVDGVTDEIYELISPFICAREPSRSSRININSLSLQHIPLLASVFSHEDDGLELAARLITERPSGGYETMSALREAPALENIDQSKYDFDAYLVTEPEYIWVEADIRFLDAQRFMAVDFLRSADRLQLIKRYSTPEARRAVLQKDDPS